MKQGARSIPGIDANIRRLVNALNAFDGITTIGSCGGHPKPLKGGQWPEGTWYVKMKFRHDARGWRALEFLAWLINNDYARAGHQVVLIPTAAPPYLNGPGRVLSFVIEGRGGEDPNALARWMNKARTGVFVPVGAPRQPEEARRGRDL